jgi:hypothetical protein
MTARRLVHVKLAGEGDGERHLPRRDDPPLVLGLDHAVEAVVGTESRPFGAEPSLGSGIVNEALVSSRSSKLSAIALVTTRWTLEYIRPHSRHRCLRKIASSTSAGVR